jgi:magnesium transporter
MEIFVFRRGSEKVLEGFSENDLAGLLSDSENTIWVDLRGETEDDLIQTKRVLRDIFRFHHLTIEDCIETRNQPKIEAFPDYLYFIVHGVKPGESRPDNFVTRELDGYLGQNFLVTFHLEKFRSIKDVKQQIRSSPFIISRGPAYLLHQILDRLVDNYIPLVDEFDTAINDLEERLLDKRKTGDHAILEEIIDVRRAVARLKRISTRQLQVLYRLSHGEFPIVPENVLPFYRDVYDHLQRIVDLAETYRELVSSLFEIHFAAMANKTNEVMKTLAVVSAIILPLSLIAGIYGMNFENMPELRSPYGYFITLGIMAALAILLIYYFKKRGWIFQKESEADEADPSNQGQ